MDARTAASPKNHKQLLMASFSLYRKSLPRVLLYGLGLAVFLFLPNILAIFTHKNFLFIPGHFYGQQLWFIVTQIVSSILIVGILWDLQCTKQGNPESVAADMRMGIKKMIYIFLAIFVQSGILSMFIFGLNNFNSHYTHHQLLLTMYPFGILTSRVIMVIEALSTLYLVTLFLFFAPLIALENYGVFSSLQRSAMLVWRHWWQVISLQIIPWVCYILILIFFNLLLGISVTSYMQNPGIHTIDLLILHLTIVTIFIPWVAAILYVQLKDLELRKYLNI